MIRHGLVCTTKEWHWKSGRRCATWWSSNPILARWQRVQFWTVSTLILCFQSFCQHWYEHMFFYIVQSSGGWEPLMGRSHRLTTVRHFRIYSKSQQATLQKLRVWANASLVTESWIWITLPKNVEEIYQHWRLVRMLGLFSIRLFSVGCHKRSGNEAKPLLNPPQSNFKLEQQYFKFECSGRFYIL
jgi:hypothetical protein